MRLQNVVYLIAICSASFYTVSKYSVHENNNRSEYSALSNIKNNYNVSDLNQVAKVSAEFDGQKPPQNIEKKTDVIENIDSDKALDEKATDTATVRIDNVKPTDIFENPIETIPDQVSVEDFRGDHEKLRLEAEAYGLFQLSEANPPQASETWEEQQQIAKINSEMDKESELFDEFNGRNTNIEPDVPHENFNEN